MSDVSIGNDLITEHIDIWTSTVKTKSASGRGSSKKIDLYGIKKLRELILELAVRGKLVPQDPSDEPASKLLERIAAEKAQLVKEKKIKKPKALPEISEEEKPFELPEGWALERFGNFGSTNVGLTYSPKDTGNTGIPVLRSSNIQKGKIDLSDLVRVNKEVKDSVFVEVGDLIICARNGSKALVGKTAQIKALKEPMAFGAFMAIFRSTLNEYVEVFLNSPIFRRNLEGVSTTTINQITQSNLVATICPIPPLKEQYRIVAKVDELMALCDQLEQQTESQIEAQQTLVGVLLETLTASTSHNELMQNWQRLSEHFDTLFTTEQSIDQLKQTILQLAVMGRLVPQDPTDEPASKLLERIAAEKAQLIADKKIKKQKALPPISDDEKPFELPEGWEVERLGNLVSKMGSGSTPRGGQSAYINIGIPFLRSQNVWNGYFKLDDIAYISKETHDKMENTKVYPNDILLNITGASLGRSAIFPEKLIEANVSQHVTIIRLIDQGMLGFVHLGIISPLIQNLVWGRQVGMAIEGLSKKVLEQFEFPVPPLNEQHRIVTKVDELMAICDQLKAKLNQSQQTQLHLTDAIVEQVV